MFNSGVGVVMGTHLLMQFNFWNFVSAVPSSQLFLPTPL